jgi:hypothetical protein
VVSYASPSSRVVGTNTLTIAVPAFAQSTVDRAMLNGAIIESPPA